MRCGVVAIAGDRIIGNDDPYSSMYPPQLKKMQSFREVLMKIWKSLAECDILQSSSAKVEKFLPSSSDSPQTVRYGN
jgi:hypothetical protein